MTVKVGIAGWIDKSLIDSGLFYPMNAKSSEERLQFYASQFSLVEVDSTYYGMPKKENSDLWVARTPAGFTFDVKSFSLFTNHPTKPMALPKDIRDQLPEKLREKNIYIEQMPPELVDVSWERFREALEPLRAAGKLGAVFFQFPPWFLPSSRSLAYVEQCQERMYGFQIAVEFRKPEWLDARHLEGTRAFLRTRDIPYIAVDVPQGHKTSMPPAYDVTSSKLAVVRFHGRNHETWELKGAPPNLRFRYDYSDQELSEWVPRIKEMEKSAKEVHALMNNNYSNYSVKNAKQLEKLLAAWQKYGSAQARRPEAARFTDGVIDEPAEDRLRELNESVWQHDRIPARKSSCANDQSCHPRGRVLWADGRLGGGEELGPSGCRIDDADLHTRARQLPAKCVREAYHRMFGRRVHS